jgi:hypothetical protein
MEQQFQTNVNRYAEALQPYGFALAPGYTTVDRVVFSHENGYALELKSNRVWRLINAAQDAVRSSDYLNDLTSSLDSRISKGEFTK